MWAQQTFRDEGGALSWIQEVVAPKVQNFASWSHVLKSGDVSWRAGRSTAMIQWLNFLVEATFGTAYDESLKLVWKDDPDKAFSGPTFAAVVESIKSRIEKPPTPEQLPSPATEEDKEAVNSDVEFEVPEDKDGEKHIKIMRTSNMEAETRAEVKRICNAVRLQLRAQVQLVPHLVSDRVSPEHFVNIERCGA